jgi:hypothetical protein
MSARRMVNQDDTDRLPLADHLALNSGQSRPNIRYEVGGLGLRVQSLVGDDGGESDGRGGLGDEAVVGPVAHAPKKEDGDRMVAIRLT